MEEDSKEVVAEYLTQIIKGLVSVQDEVQVATSVDEQGVLFRVKVNEDEWGKVIGKQGKTAKTIRDILRIKGSIHEMKASMKIDAPDFNREETESE